MKTLALPDGRVWLRVADPQWHDPLDPSYAAERGGRWNPPNSFETLYLNADIATARLQLERMLAGTPVRVDDLEDDAFILLAATLPRDQDSGDAVSEEGLATLGLPSTYPCDAGRHILGHAITQAVGRRLHESRVRGVWCRSACTDDGSGRELAWFPATSRSRARPVWAQPLSLVDWREADQWEDIGLEHQSDP